MAMQGQVWFEMPEIRRRNYARATWVPIRAAQIVKSIGGSGEEGYQEEYFGLGSVAIQLDRREEANELGWMDVGLRHDNRGWVQEGSYIPATVFRGDEAEHLGEWLILKQHFNSVDLPEWHLAQDFVLTLGLKREGDHWVRPEEDYIEVARLTRSDDGSPELIEVRAQHLRDYLCARRMALLMTIYRSRTEICASYGHITWDEGSSLVEERGDKWEGRVMPIHEGGMPFGEGMSVFHMSRTDVDPEEDAPALGFPTDANTKSKHWTKKFKGKKLYRIMGELWREEWIEPAATSPIVRDDEVPSTTFFIVDPSGNRESEDDLIRGDGRWLWFQPDVVMRLLDHRGSNLKWYTRDTGGVSCGPDHGVHFGINSLGLINVYAKDIGLLPEWQQKIWAGFNVSPEGKVSSELLDSQVKAEPARTQAPEAFLEAGLERVKVLSAARFGAPFIRDHERTQEILKQIHRFRALSRSGLLVLAKDIARVTADALDVSALQKVVSPPKGGKWGSLRSLQGVLQAAIGESEARDLMSPLFKVYELRLGDAHMPSHEIDEALAFLRIDTGAPYVMQGFQLLACCVTCLYQIGDVLEGRAQQSESVGS